VTSKRSVLVLVLIPAAVLLVSGSQPWVTGRTTDAVLGPATLAASGSQVAPGVLALAAVTLVSLVATLSGGLRIRRLSAAVMAAAAVGVAVLVAGVVRDPSGALGRRAAEQLGRTGSVAADGTLGGWAVAAAAAAAALVLAAVLALAAVGRWQGLSARFDRPATADGADGADARGAHRSSWDELSDGHDPTVGPPRGR